MQGSQETAVEVVRPVNADVGARVAFRLMDPCCIAPDIGQYDAVVINEVLDRTVSPKATLGRIGGVNPIVKRGGAAPPSHRATPVIVSCWPAVCDLPLVIAGSMCAH